MHVCQLSRDDLPWIVEQLRALPGQSTVYRDVPDDVPYVLGYFEYMQDTGSLMGAVHRDTQSFILAAKMRPWYANRVEIHEIILWVPEQFRGSYIAGPLIKEFTRYARDDSPHSIHVGASLDITSADRTLKLYERYGYTREGSGAVMRL